MKLSCVIKKYTRFKLALGADFRIERHILKRFTKTVGNVKLNDISEEKTQKFLMGRGALTRTYLYRHSALKGFFKFALSRGYCSYSPLPKTLPKVKSNFTPYIYSLKDIRKLLTWIDKLPVRAPQIEPETLRVVIILLYGAMLRISEALRLNVDDVDLRQGVLTIHDSKFRKTRIVPIGPKLKGLLSKYASSRHSSEYKGRFFISKKKKELLIQSVEERFSDLRRAAGFKKINGREPRLHDFRHTGVVHRILDWYKRGKDVNKLLPLLSVYLGHARLRDTQVYMTVIPTIMRYASRRFEKYAFEGVAS